MKLSGLVAVRAVLIGVAIAGAAARDAGAQTPPAAAGGKTWELEIHGGWLSGAGPGGGTGQLPPAGGPYTALPGMPATRQVPSWFFGDGALLFNQARATFAGLSLPPIVPLDDTLQRSVVRRRPSGVFGFRAGKWLTARFGAEFSLDMSRGHLVFVDTLQPAVDASLASFASAFTTLWGSAPQIATDSTKTDDSGSQLFATGALNIALTRGAAFESYGTIGMGFAKAGGGAPSFSVTGSYQPGTPALFKETDAISVDVQPDTGIALVLGAGLRRAIGMRGGFRVDVRVLLIHDTTSNLVTTVPALIPGPLPAVVATPSTPAMVFTTTSLVKGSLSTQLSDFATFTGSGLRPQTAITAGYFFKF